jgi:antitoxin ParD1/3/4
MECIDQSARSSIVGQSHSPRFVGLILAIFCHRLQTTAMSTMNISLPDDLKSFVDNRIRSEGYGSSSEYMRELIRRDRDRAQFRQYLLKGFAAPAGRMDDTYFASLRKKLKGAGKKKA